MPEVAKEILGYDPEVGRVVKFTLVDVTADSAIYQSTETGYRWIVPIKHVIIKE